MAVMMRGQFSDLFAARLAYLNEVMFETFDAPTLTYNQVFNVVDSTKAYEEKTGVGPFSLFEETSEGSTISYESLQQLYDKRWTHVKYTKGFQITEEASEDDMDNVISNAAPALGRKARNSIEVEAYSDLNGAFATTTTADGAYLCASHSLAGGGTFSNLISGDLAQGTLESALNKFADMVDEQNDLVNVQARRLVIPNELRWTATELLKSQLRSDTANNAINALSQVGLDVLIVPYLTGDDDWFLMSAPKDHSLMFYWRREPRTDHALDFDTGNLKTKMTMRFSHSPFMWYGIVGGQGS
jgi:phage major head subunit gpT-like protein